MVSCISLPSAYRCTVLSPAPAEPAASDPGRRFVELGRAGQLVVPPPGRGATVSRWAALARWARTDPALGRLAEGHVDAVAILAEAGCAPVPGALYGVWAARSGGDGAELVEDGELPVVRGTVRFCSGAHLLDRALVVARAGSGPGQSDTRPAGSQVIDVSLASSGIDIVEGSWLAAGMRASDSVDVRFTDVSAPADQWVGRRGFYTDRLGFWWGGAGVAAAWLGAARGVVDHVQVALTRAVADAHQRALLGAVHAELAAADALLVHTAELIDTEPRFAHRTAVWTVRAAVERCCRTVLEVAPRLVGVAELTRRPGFEQRLADLSVYVRQHHGERDLAALGAAVLETPR